MNWNELIGKKVVALRGWTQPKDRHHPSWVDLKTVPQHCPLSFILFDDGETFIELDEQSPYDYHDCSASARNLELRKDAKRWKEMYDKEGNWNEADDTACPF